MPKQTFQQKIDKMITRRELVVESANEVLQSEAVKLVQPLLDRLQSRLNFPIEIIADVEAWVYTSDEDRRGSLSECDDTAKDLAQMKTPAIKSSTPEWVARRQRKILSRFPEWVQIHKVMIALEDAHVPFPQIQPSKILRFERGDSVQYRFNKSWFVATVKEDDGGPLVLVERLHAGKTFEREICRGDIKKL